MDEREELMALRRLAELEAKAGTNAKAQAQAQQQAQAAQYAGEPVKDAGIVTRTLGGAKHAFDRAAAGLQGLMPQSVQDAANWIDERLPGHTPLTREQVKQGEAFVKEGGPAAKVGEIAGDIAITAPLAASGASALGAAGRVLPRALGAVGNPFVSAAASNAAANALVAPEDRGKAALWGAVGGAGGEAVGRGLGRVLGGPVGGNVTDDAAALMAQGVDVPLWKATPNRGVRFTAETSRALPVTRQIIQGQEGRAINQWNQNLIREASPPVPVLDDAGRVLRWEAQPVQGAGQQALQEVHRNFNRAYDALYGGRTIPVDDAYRAEIQNIVRNARAYLPSEAEAVEGLIRRANDTLAAGTGTTTRTVRQAAPLGSGRVSARITTPAETVTELGHVGATTGAVGQAVDELERAITTAWRQGNADRAEVLEQALDAVTSLRTRGLPPEVQSMASEINSRYANYKTLQKAAAMMGAQAEGGVVTPRQLLGAIRGRDKSPDKSLFARGMAPGQQAAQRAQRVLGDELPTVGPGTAEKLMPAMLLMMAGGGVGGIPGLAAATGAAGLATPAGQRYLAGGYGWQETARNAGPALAAALRRYGATIPLRD